MALKKIEFEIDQNRPETVKANGTVAVMSDIFTWTCPQHVVLKLRPTDRVAAYLKDAGAEALATDDVEISIVEPGGYGQNVIFAGQYGRLKEFDDVTKTRKIGRMHIVTPGMVVKFRVKATTVLVVSTCYFSIAGELNYRSM